MHHKNNINDCNLATSLPVTCHLKMLLPQFVDISSSIAHWLAVSSEPILIEGEVGSGKTFIVKV